MVDGVGWERGRRMEGLGTRATGDSRDAHRLLRQNREEARDFDSPYREKQLLEIYEETVGLIAGEATDDGKPRNAEVYP